MSNYLDELGEVIFFIIPVTIMTLVAILIRPFFFLSDHRRFIIKPNLYNRGPYKFYCYMHYALKEDGKCPNCGIPKRELVR